MVDFVAVCFLYQGRIRQAHMNLFYAVLKQNVGGDFQNLRMTLTQD